MLNEKEKDFVGSLKALLVRYNAKLERTERNQVRFISDSGEIILYIDEVIEGLDDE